MTQRATSNIEIMRVVPNCRFIPYSDLWKIRSLDELLPRSIILYQNRKIGHWITVFENHEGINVFDSLGYLPDEELSLFDLDIRNRYHENYTYLTKLLSQAPYIIYNENRYQKRNTSTCGMHVAFRLYNSDLTNDEYRRLMNMIPNKDVYVSKFFLKKLNNS